MNWKPIPGDMGALMHGERGGDTCRHLEML